MKLFLSLVITINLFGFNIDYKVDYDDSPIIAAHYDIPKYTYFGLIGLALYEGTQSRLGKTAWKSLDAGIISQIVTEGLKRITTRVRPRDATSPDEWFTGDGMSFPSGHVSGMMAIVTPFVLEYQEDSFWIHSLWLLPAYQMIGRVKTHAHWQSDVIAAAIVGFYSGYIAYKKDTPFLLYFTEKNSFVGVKYYF